MTIHFESLFSKQMEAMIMFREALGYSRGSYYQFLLNFDRFCKKHFPNQSILTEELVMEWGRKRVGENANGVKRRLIAIRQFSKYLNSIGVNAYIVPVEMIGRYESFQPYIFTDTELKIFFQSTDRFPVHKLFPLRELIVPVFFRLLYCCGLRPNEARELKYFNINLKTGIIYITETKAHKDRTIVIAQDLLKLCCRYDILINSICSNRQYFFQRPDGNPYTVGWIQDQFWKCWKIAEITEFHGTRPRVYDFRHNYATRILQKWLNEGKDLYIYLPYLSTYMGHSDFTQTAYYIHLLPEQLKRTATIDWKKFETIIPEVK